MVALALLLVVSAVYAQGIEFQEKSYAEALKMAKKQKKLVFIDVYTSWCGPCKQMAKEVFTQQKVGDFYNARFLNLKLDAEKNADGKTVASRFEVSAYPTMLFVDGNGELIYRLVGSRSIDQLIEEGQKALNAYAARPLLEKNEKMYLKGKRDKQFLNDYFELRDKAGLDGSEVLVDYFAQVKDEELLDSVNVARIAKVAVYEPALANRFVETLCQKTKGVKDKRAMAKEKKSLCIYLGACLKDVMKGDDVTKIEEVLGLKSRLFEGAGISESVMMASLGGGNIYLFSDLLRLDYYRHKAKKELFVSLYEDYVLKVIANAEKRNAEQARLEEEMIRKMEEAKNAGNEHEYQRLKGMRGMMSAFSGMDDYYISTQLLEHMETYLRFYKGEKDRTFEDKTVSWYKALHRVNPSAKTAVFVADKLLEMGRKQEALEELEFAVVHGQEAMGVESSDLEACRKKLEDLKQQKD